MTLPRARSPASASASGEIYKSDRLASGYAFARPPVHPRIVDLIARHPLMAARPIQRALDVGCGAGLSTAALAHIAPVLIGLEPAEAMLDYGKTLVPAASFVVGRAEHLPFAAQSFDLVTAAGALNYTDRIRSLEEVGRVLAPGGVLTIYDFSSGRRSGEAAALGGWFHAFEQRYPYPGGYAMDPQALEYSRAGLRLAAYEPFAVSIVLALESYLAYVLTEANVASAIASGVPEDEVRAWCRDSLRPVFGAASYGVVFEGYIAYVVAS